jgi:hypothetical protein
VVRVLSVFCRYRKGRWIWIQNKCVLLALYWMKRKLNRNQILICGHRNPDTSSRFGQIVMSTSFLADIIVRISTMWNQNGRIPDSTYLELNFPFFAMIFNCCQNKSSCFLHRQPLIKGQLKADQTILSSWVVRARPDALGIFHCLCPDCKSGGVFSARFAFLWRWTKAVRIQYICFRYNQNESKRGTNSLMLVPAATKFQGAPSPKRWRRCHCNFSKREYRVMIRLWTLIFSIPRQDLGKSFMADFLRHRIDICVGIQSLFAYWQKYPCWRYLIKIKYKRRSWRS